MAAGVGAAWERIPKPQLGAILALWIVFLVSQRQKSKHHHCTWGYGVWCTFQVGAPCAGARAAQEEMRLGSASCCSLLC